MLERNEIIFHGSAWYCVQDGEEEEQAETHSERMTRIMLRAQVGMGGWGWGMEDGDGDGDGDGFKGRKIYVACCTFRVFFLCWLYVEEGLFGMISS